MALAPKGLPPRQSGVGERSEPEEDCCNYYHTAITFRLIRIQIIKHQSSIRLALILRAIHLSPPLGESKYKKTASVFVSTRFLGYARNDTPLCHVEQAKRVETSRGSVA